ncbi:cell division protein FtsQ/DivIB [Collinsella sp. LCP19S3_C9]|uniref:cell division protein FtsQ/DivIB n=2 Tax=unclassified Collinsella TaxID=2637548 RepID=UPI003F8F8DB6
MTPKSAMGAKPSRPIVTPKPSLGAKATHPGRALGAAKPRSLTSVPATKAPATNKGINPLSSLGAMASKTSEAASAVKGKGKIVGGILAAVAVLAVVAIVVINSGLFAATDIQIEGSEHVTKHDAMQLISLPENTSLFNVNPDQITEDLKQNPWVSGVDVQRQFPHTLVITPTERKVTAIAYISSDDLAWAIGDDDTWIAPLSTSVEVDDQGNVVTSGEGANTLSGIDAALALAKHYGAVLLTDVSADVEPVSGRAVSSKAVKAGLDYVRGFSGEFLAQIKDISIPSVEAISANLDNGVEVSLGDSDDIAKKERVVTKLLSQVEGVTYINVRSPGNYTFRNAPTA